MRVLVWTLTCALAAGLAVRPSSAAEGQGEGEKDLETEAVPSDFREIIPEQEEAVKKAVEWLAKQQSRDGSWSGNSGQNYPCAMTGLAGLALLSQGTTPGRGLYGQNVMRAVEWLLKQQDKSTGMISNAADGRSMYGHGFALTFLAECYGMIPAEHELSARLKECLDKGVKLIARAQSRLGGWYYSPDSGNDEGSVTITQVQALRACRNVGVDVPFKIIDRAIDYIKKSQQPDGGIAYRAGMSGSRPALSAAGAELLMMAGLYEDKATRKALAYLRTNITAGSTQGQHDSYTTFYTAQALHQVQGRQWADYFTQRRARYLREQSRDGSWRYTGWGSGPVFDTAIAVIVLSLPYEYLPIYQR